MKGATKRVVEWAASVSCDDWTDRTEDRTRYLLPCQLARKPHHRWCAPCLARAILSQDPEDPIEIPAELGQ
jgi:hypothetical protein